ncbi:hypothetical protein H5993_05175 [Lactobacillus alvi]|uniref:Tetratricopeptide repeat protein n=1 Tax=Limosilactobacillus alvi TaxID=990412 RepID=A0ABS2ENY3_9LACO|nr:hypothetical protein [Limosilactobacillus alvi]MBM6754149.1 hypothetical protein [Limosilactobacillus alvi]
MIVTILIIIVILAFMNRRSRKDPNSKIKDTTPTNHDVSLPSFQEIKSYLKSDVPSKKENGKLVNGRTGYKLAKETSIERSKNDLKQALEINRNNNDFIEQAKYDDSKATIATDDYLSNICIPYYFGGVLAYKQGDWDLAEKWWLMVLDIRPTNSAKKLEIMYRKQKRYKDNVIMYEKAIEYSKRYDKLTNQHLTKHLAELKKTCSAELNKKSKNDHSIGIQEYPSMIDFNFIDKLQRIAQNNAN